MSLSLEYSFFIANCCYLLIFVVLQAIFQHKINKLDQDKKKRMNEYLTFFFFSNIALIVILLLQTIRALLVALPGGDTLTQESVLCFEQGITLLISIVALLMHIHIFAEDNRRIMEISFSFFQIPCVAICGLTMNILTYYGL